MQIKHEDMLKIKELMELATAYKDYVDTERQIFIFIVMSSKGLVSSIEFNKDYSWAMPFYDMSMPLEFIPLTIFAEYEFDTTFHIEDLV